MPHQVRRLNAAAPIGYSSVSDGALEILSDEGLIVRGSQYVSGLFRGDGTFDWSGPMKFAGDVSVTKTLDVTAAARFRDDVSIEKKLDVTAETRLRAKTTVEADLDVVLGGKINVGTRLALDPGTNAGAVVFSNTSKLISDGTTLVLFNNNGFISLTSTAVLITFGSHRVELDASGVRMPSLPAAGTGANAATAIGVTSNGYVRRMT
ncbi:hypothetical protein D9V32_13435 [Mycetocola tolaasinivorans]|uniref:Uncharacterized protein n=2 Tax=Mycetocola tolaasinivorans TaxID=76635 RepID=A0A3L7A2W1_9MICO|nr:hypothetical protein D9V32_13435 [Mycetocola tolaasinivorans]